MVLAAVAGCCVASQAAENSSVSSKPAIRIVPEPSVGSAKSSSAALKPALSPSQVFDRVKDSVVVVKTFNVRGENISLGSGVLLPSGKIGTNCHVVKNGASFQVGGGTAFVSATLWGGDESKDICLLYAEGPIAKPARLRSAESLKVGEPVYAIGAPEGLELSLSNGIVSQLRGGPPPLIQTTAAISHGSSGGGLFDGEGRLVGFTTMYIAGGQNLNFAMPAEWASEIQAGTKTASGRTVDAVNASWMEVARGFESENAWNELRSLAERKIEVDSKDVDGWYFFALANFRLEKGADAINAAKVALDLNRDRWQTWLLLGDIQSVGGADWKMSVNDAIYSYREVLRLKPDHVESMVSLSYLYRELTAP